MRNQRGDSFFEFMVFVAAVVVVTTLIVNLHEEDPELRDGVLVVDKINCPTVVPGEDSESHCILSVTTTDPSRLTATQHILLLKEGEELQSSDEESE